MKTYKNNLIFSVIFHVLLLAVIFINFTSNFSVPGSAQIVHAYVAKSSVQLNTQQHSINLSSSGLMQRPSDHNNSHSSSQKSIPQIQTISGDQINHLISLIYKAISQHQNYPEGLQLSQNTKVIISFILTPNGSIHAVHITQSSGNTRLDTAAVLAVNEAQPINGVAPYLTSAQDFAIPIVYRA